MDGLVTTDMDSASLHNSEPEETTDGSQKQEVVAMDFSVDGSIVDTVQILGQLEYDFEKDDLALLLRSFDMVFQLHQRSEEIRPVWRKIYGILLNSRSVAGLIERVTRTLENRSRPGCGSNTDSRRSSCVFRFPADVCIPMGYHSRPLSCQ